MNDFVVRSQDVLQRFLFENTAVRGEIVRLHASWQAILERKDYPPAVRDLLGEAMAAMALLGATIKYDGALTLQMQGNGPVSLLVVQVSANNTLRGMAQCAEDVEYGSLKELLGNANLVITVEQRSTRERYQGIVDLGDGGLAEALERYFVQSEQLDTRLFLAADSQHAAGVLLQAMPDHEDDSDDWNRLTTLADTLTDEELLDLPFDELLHRLYHEEDLRIFEPDPVSFRCSCSSEKIENTLRSLGHEEVSDIIRTEGEVVIDCQFCNQRYAYDVVDVEALFAEDSVDGPKTRQ